MKTFLKICLYTFVGLMLIGFIGTLFDDKKTDTAEGKTALSDSADSTVTKAQAKPVTKEDFAERLKRETESWKKHKPGVGYSEPMSFTIQVAAFYASARLADSAIHHPDAGIKKLGKGLKDQIAKVQANEFPIMRKAYRKLLHDKLWVNNVETEISGSTNSIITFTGGTFANNKNKQDAQDALHDMLRLLRFKQSRYKWYEGDDRYTYYEMKTPKDGEVLIEL